MKERLQKGEITPDVIDSMLPNEKEALKSLLEEVVSEKLKVSVSPEEVKKIKELADTIDTTQKKVGEDLGNPAKLEDNLAFFKARKAMEDYLASRAPASRTKVLTGTIGRAAMLASVKSPLLNIGSNFEIGFTESLARRISRGEFSGTDSKLATDYVKMANKVYQETGYDISRMTSLADTGTSGERILGQTVHAQGPGAIRKVGRVAEDIVFKQLMGAPDVAFASVHYADSVNLNAIKMAKGDKALAKEYMTDAMRLEPKTEQGQILRDQAILDSQKATWTDKTWASRVSEGIRKILNDVSGDARVGDYLLPFVKTPANIIATGMDYAGMGIPKALVKTVKAFKSGEIGSQAHLQSISGDLVRAGLGLTGAFLIANQLKNEDFVGAYDPKRAQIEQLRNSNYNAIRVGDKWISADWLGPLAVPVTAMMYAKKYGNTLPEQTFQYGKGVLSEATQIPGVKDVYDYVKSNAFQANQTLPEAAGAAAQYVTSQVASRLVPSISSDLAKALDPIVRDTSGSGVAGIVNPLKAKIPGLSQTLPAKQTVFGEPVKGEGPLSDILFGARVKTSHESPLVTEISTVSNDTGKGVAFTDWRSSSSKQLAQFKQKVGGSKYDEARIKYGQELQKQLKTAFGNPQYQKMSPEDKLKVINAQDADAMSKVFRQYGFKYKPAPTVKTTKL